MTTNKLAELSILIGAIQKQKELSQLVKFLQRLSKPKVVVEIGTAKGGTLWLWCQLADDDAKIVSVDLPFGEFGGGYSIEQQKYFTTFRNANQNLHFIRDNSHSNSTEYSLKSILNGDEIDILFIDGDHTYSGVKDDYYRYEKYVKQGGIIIFHDIVVHPDVPNCKVERFWNELKVAKEYVEFIDNTSGSAGWGRWGGIGLLINKYDNVR